MVKERQFYVTLVKIAVPAAFQQFISLLIILVDNIMVTALDPNGLALAAISQANALTIFYTAVITGLAGGSTVLISQYWGRKDMVRIKQVFSIVITISVSVSALVVTFISMFPSLVLGITIPSGSTAMMGIALDYFTIVCFSFIPYAISAVLVSMLRSVEAVSVSLFSSGVSLVINIVLNYAFIFGRFGFPAMGVKGMALATITARLAELAIVWAYTFRFQKQLRIRPRDLLKSERWLWLDFIRYGLPVGVVDAQWALVGFIKAIFVKHMGEMFIAANAVTTDFINLCLVFTFALASGACVVIGKAAGAGDREKVRRYSGTIQLLFAVIGLCMAGVMIAARGSFISAYGINDLGVVELASALIFVGALTAIGTSYHAACFVGINRGAGDNRFVMIVDLVCGWLVVLPLCFLSVFVFQWPPVIFFLCTRIDQCYKWIIALVRLRGDKWIRNVTRD